jgi:UDP-N-acetylmuramyl pentapeptide phosphotransferase/UDP-N-acetylglucosamine-1-phosphate transferase
MLDQPNERSLHSKPVPRTGGIAILASIYLCGLLALSFLGVNALMPWLATAGLLIAMISYIDDRTSLAPASRIIAHLAAALLLLWGGFGMDVLELPGITWVIPQFFGVFVSAIFIVWMVNLYNFMDGMDGFAAGMAAIGFSALAGLGWLSQDLTFMVLNLIVAAASTGFLVLNFPPARIFMGDVGSSTLGLFAAAFILWGARTGVFPIWIGILVFAPFVVDATVTLLRRIVRGEKVWQAHKSHYYQRLVQLGWGHRKTVLLEYGLMLGCSLTALFIISASIVVQWAALITWSIIFAGIFFWVQQFDARSHARTF